MRVIYLIRFIDEGGRPIALKKYAPEFDAVLRQVSQE